MPQALNEPVFKKGIEIARTVNLEPKELQAYRKSKKIYLDMMNVIETARKEGVTKGEAIGEARGEARGIAKEKTDIALNLIKIGIPLDKIIIATGLSKEAIVKLRKKLK